MRYGTVTGTYLSYGKYSLKYLDSLCRIPNVVTTGTYGGTGTVGNYHTIPTAEFSRSLNKIGRYSLMTYPAPLP